MERFVLNILQLTLSVYLSSTRLLPTTTQESFVSHMGNRRRRRPCLQYDNKSRGIFFIFFFPFPRSARFKCAQFQILNEISCCASVVLWIMILNVLHFFFIYPSRPPLKKHDHLYYARGGRPKKIIIKIKQQRYCIKELFWFLTMVKIRSKLVTYVHSRCFSLKTSEQCHVMMINTNEM